MEEYKLDELTLIFNKNTMLHKELKEYISSLDGIYDIKIDIDSSELYIKYDSKIIPTKIVIKEIYACLEILKVPSLTGFDKHSENKNQTYKIQMDTICCEYCLMGIIEDLLSIKGIQKVDTDYDDIEHRENFSINIEYNEVLISEKEIIELVNKI